MTQDRKGDVHFCCPMLVVLPHGPEHPRQGRQEAAIDGRQRRECRLFGPRQVGLELRTEGRKNIMQQRRVEHGGRFTQRAQRGASDAEVSLYVREGGQLLQASQARHGWVEKVYKQQGRVLIIEQLPVPGAVPRGANRMQMVEQGPQKTKILEAWEGLGYYGRRHT